MENPARSSYFAYGLNMDVASMAERFPGATIIGPALVKNRAFRITAHGVATLVLRTGSEAWGLLWSVTRRDIDALDWFEGVRANFYRRVEIQVERPGGEPVKAWIYLAVEARRGRPRHGYMETVIEGAIEAGLPEDWVEKLRQWSV